MNAKELTEMYALEKDHWWFKAKRRLILQFLKRYGKRGKLLDVGCGTGIILTSLKKESKVYGVDASKVALSFCRLRGLKNLKQGFAENISYDSNMFDVVVASDLLEHTNDVKTLKEIHRVLKKDGITIITVPAYTFLWTKHDDIACHKRRYTRKELKNKLLKEGFEIQKISYWNTLLFPLTYVYKMLSTGLNIKKSSNMINKLLFFILSIDNLLIRVINLPFGVSVVCVAKKVK